MKVMELLLTWAPCSWQTMRRQIIYEMTCSFEWLILVYLLPPTSIPLNEYLSAIYMLLRVSLCTWWWSKDGFFIVRRLMKMQISTNENYTLRYLWKSHLMAAVKSCKFPWKSNHVYLRLSILLKGTVDLGLGNDFFQVIFKPLRIDPNPLWLIFQMDIEWFLYYSVSISWTVG